MCLLTQDLAQATTSARVKRARSLERARAQTCISKKQRVRAYSGRAVLNVRARKHAGVRVHELVLGGRAAGGQQVYVTMDVGR
jgi:hypothetical protein